MIVFYVSGHGYGHAARTAAVMTALGTLRPAMRIAVRTQAPRFLFPAFVEYHQVEVDSAVVESGDALTVDIQNSVEGVVRLLGHADAIVEREVRFLAQSGARVVVADIPFLAGFIAREACLPGIAMGNFLWDWIYEGCAEPALLQRIRAGYSGLTQALRLPLSHQAGWEVFSHVKNVPLVTPRSGRPRDAIRQELGIYDENRPVVLIGGRARLTPDILDRVRRECPEFLFLTPDLHSSFSDLLRASDIVVAKVGYSIAAECIAEGRRLLFPPRKGFREEEILLHELPHYLTLEAIDPAEWAEGNWKADLVRLANTSASIEHLPSDGAEICAAQILHHS